MVVVVVVTSVVGVFVTVANIDDRYDAVLFIWLAHVAAQLELLEVLRHVDAVICFAYTHFESKLLLFQSVTLHQQYFPDEDVLCVTLAFGEPVLLVAHAALPDAVSFDHVTDHVLDEPLYVLPVPSVVGHVIGAVVVVELVVVDVYVPAPH